MEKNVSIIILNWNGLEDTIKCIESLKKITYEDYKIIVVDNASEGNDVEELKSRFNDYIYVIKNDRNYGYAEGNNIGIKFALESGTDYILILNNDIVVDPYFLNALIEVSETETNVGIASPKTYYLSKPDTLFSVGGKLNVYLGQHKMIGTNQKDSGKFDSIQEFDFVAGACMLIQKQVIEKVGLIPTEYFLQWEDIDYCYQMRKNGFRCLYVPKAKIWHKVGASFDRHKQNYVAVMRGIKNRFIFSNKNLTKFQLPIFLILFSSVTMPTYILYYLLYYRDIKRIFYFYKGYFQGLKYTANKLLLSKPIYS